MRKREFKNLHHIEMECVMDLEYMLLCNKKNLDSIEFFKIKYKLDNKEYDEFLNNKPYSSIIQEPKEHKRVEVREYKLSADNMQYCFF